MLVTDSAGSIVENATAVLLAKKYGDPVREVEGDSSGRIYFENLPMGTLYFWVTAPGFQKHFFSVVLRSSQEFRIDLQVDLGVIGEVIITEDKRVQRRTWWKPF